MEGDYFNENTGDVAKGGYPYTLTNKTFVLITRKYRRDKTKKNITVCRT
jgi:hypothetical protein